MSELKKDMTIIFSTHILSDADEISDELLLLHQGKIVESGSMNELRKKYQTAIIELEFDNNVEKFEHILNQFKTINHTSLKQNIWKLHVTDIELARQEISKYFVLVRYG